MAGTLQIKHGAKMRVAYDAPVGQEPKFNMVCTFNKAIDESRSEEHTSELQSR